MFAFAGMRSVRIASGDVKSEQYVLTASDFARGRKNPYAEKLRKYGYKIVIHVTAEDILAMEEDNKNTLHNLEAQNWLDLDQEEIEALNITKTLSKSDHHFVKHKKTTQWTGSFFCWIPLLDTFVGY